MITLKYTYRERDEKLVLNEDQANFSVILDTIKSLFNTGVKMVAIESKKEALNCVVYFDNDPRNGDLAITGRFLTETRVIK